MSYKKDFDLFVGAKSGVFKGVKLSRKACIMKNIQSLVSIRNDDIVTTVSWGDEEEKEILIACGENGVRSVKVYDTECSTFTCSFFCDSGEGSINGISRYDGAILTAVKSGHIKLWRFEEQDQIILNAGENLHKMKHSSINKKIIATGGLENKLKLFDLERQKQIFIEKNLPHDSLELRVPIWISDIGYLPGTEQIATAGRYGHVRLYDPIAQRRPVIKLEIQDEALTSLAVTHREKQIIVGSGKGRMNLVDFRNTGKVLNTYTGSVGGITGIACSKVKPYVVSVGLDRYLRVHDIDTKQQLKNVYLTSKLTCIALRSEFSLDTNENDEQSQTREFNERTASTNDDNDNEYKNISNGTLPKLDTDSDAEYDALFDKMQVVTTKEDQENTPVQGKQKRFKRSIKKSKKIKTVEASI